MVDYIHHPVGTPDALQYVYKGFPVSIEDPVGDLEGTPEEAMKRLCDEYGNFARCDDGTIEFNDFIQLRAIMLRQANRAFGKRRLELNEKLLEGYRRRWNYFVYKDLFVEGKEEYQQHIDDMTTAICSKIGLDRIKYVETEEKYRQDPDKNNTINLYDNIVRLGIPNRDIEATSEVCITAFKKIIKKQEQDMRRIKMLRFIYTQKEYKLAIAVEETKNSQMLCHDLKFDMSHMMLALKHHDIEEHTEKDKPQDQRIFTNYRKTLRDEHKLDEYAETSRMNPNEETIQKILARIAEVGDCQYSGDLIDFDYFIKYQEIIYFFVYEATYEALEEKKALRRSNVAEDGEDSWLKHVYTDVWYINKNYWMISDNVWNRLNVDEECVKRSKQLYMLDPEKVLVHDDAMTAVYEDCRRNIYDKIAPNTEILTREQVIESVKFQLDHQFDGQKRMRDYCRNFGNDFWSMDVFCKIEMMRLTDLYQLKFNIEHHDLEANCEKWDIFETDEVKAIFQEYETKCNEWYNTLDSPPAQIKFE